MNSESESKARDPQRLTFKTVPLIDFQAFLEGTGSARRTVAQAIDRVSREVGFFYLSNHGISQDLIEQTFSEAKRFFALTMAEKQAIAIEHSTCHRGYFSLGGENLDPAEQGAKGDYKEGLKIGRELALNHPLVLAQTPLHGPNQWPTNLPGWREAMQAYYAACSSLGHKLMQAFALALQLPEDYFDRWLREPMATLGPLHYPPQLALQPNTQLGAGAHSDYGCLTILAQDDKPGLQVRNLNGQWVDAPPVKGNFVINIGDMLARWSNNRWTSTQHRVINRSGDDRYSLAFFYDPEFNADISCLPSCCSLDNPPQYPPISGGHYLLERINDAFDYHRDKSKPSAEKKP